ncbi:MAG: hypothetical protein ACKOET_07800 [Verrucomicrobiota bacterium]
MNTLPFDPVPSLAAALGGLMDTALPTVAFPNEGVIGPSRPLSADRAAFHVHVAGHTLPWRAPEISTLFRGETVPPSLTSYPPEYVPYFAHLEVQIWGYCRWQGTGRDDDLRELFAELRRRPDGRHRSALHEALWQILVLTLASTPLSRAQYEAIVQRLSQSARTHALGPSSRRYIESLGMMVEGR